MALASAFFEPHTPLGLIVWAPGALLPRSNALLPPSLRRLHAALRQLPPAADVRAASAPLQPGPWCAAAPLFGTPLLPPHFAYEYDNFAAVGICTIADVLRVERALVAAHAGGAYGA